MNVVLLYPEIPQNTGTIARTCAGTDTVLHLIKPLGYSLADRYLKRAGLDYWKDVNLVVHEDWEAFLGAQSDEGVVLHPFSSHGSRPYNEETYGPDDYLVFGRESTGFPQWFRERYDPLMLRIPTNGKIRSLNLSNSVNIVLFDALSRTGLLSSW